MKVTLVYPPWQFFSPSKLFPLGISYLAAHLVRSGFEPIEVVDLNLELTEPRKVFRRAVERVARTAPDVVGVTCWTVHLPFCIEFVRRFKKRFPRVTVVLGGVHATARPEEMMRLCPADVIVRGEGEETFAALVHALQREGDLSGVGGISYREAGAIRHNPDRALIKDLDTIPRPAYHLLPPIEKYQPLNRRYVFSVLASRGCPYHCIFCSANRFWKYQRRRTPENVADEIRWLADAYSLGFVRFEDDDLTADREWALRLFGLLKEAGIRFDCLTRVDRVDAELLRAMRAAGCEGVYHGVESASARLLKLVRKDFPDWVTRAYLMDLIAEEVRLGLTPTVSAMIGIPTETRDEIRATFDLMGELRRLGAKTQLWMMTPYPDTDAVSLYKDLLVPMDRWHEFRQFDIFSTVARTAYARELKKYAGLIPDNWMFATGLEDLQEMKALYREGAGRILGEVDFV